MLAASSGGLSNPSDSGSMTSLRIFLADDDERMRRVIGALLAFHPGWQVCGEAADGEDALNKIPRVKPDIVLLDAEMPKVNGLEAARQIVRRDSACKVIILVPDVTAQIVRDVFHAGALGFVLKPSATHDLAPAIEAVHRGQSYFTPRFADMILTSCLQGGKQGADLTDHERETVRLLAEELALTLRHQWRRPPTARKFLKYLTFGVLAIATAGIWWFELNGEPDHAPPAVENLLVSLGLRSRSTFPIGGDPGAKVWVDVHTGLYYCAGADYFGKTSKGRVATQHTAQMDHFEPAGGVVCK